MAKFTTSEMYFNAVRRHVLEQSLTALSHFTATTLANTMIDCINESVYEVYQGSYQRRESVGGLTDVENINIVEVDLKDNSLSVVVRNTTKGAGDDSNQYIDAIIVNGVGYTWERSKIYRQEQSGNPLKRDFYTPTREIIEELIRDSFKARMRLLGITLN